MGVRFRGRGCPPIQKQNAVAFRQATANTQESRQRRLTISPPPVTIDNMAKRSSPITDLLRKAIVESGVPLLTIEQATGVHRASISRFIRGERSIRLDVADKLAEYFGLELQAKPKEGKG